jgi:hypothetical protein
MMSSTSPSLNHEVPPSAAWSMKGSTAIEGRRRWKLSISVAGGVMGPAAGAGTTAEGRTGPTA